MKKTITIEKVENGDNYDIVIRAEGYKYQDEVYKDILTIVGLAISGKVDIKLTGSNIN